MLPLHRAKTLWLQPRALPMEPEVLDERVLVCRPEPLEAAQRPVTEQPPPVERLLLQRLKSRQCHLAALVLHPAEQHRLDLLLETLQPERTPLRPKEVS